MILQRHCLEALDGVRDVPGSFAEACLAGLVIKRFRLYQAYLAALKGRACKVVSYTPRRVGGFEGFQDTLKHFFTASKWLLKVFRNVSKGH